jgi:hypothetical protein
MPIGFFLVLVVFASGHQLAHPLVHSLHWFIWTVQK